MLGRWVVCFLCTTIACALQADDRSSPQVQNSRFYSCKAEQLPTVWGFDSPPAKIEQHTIVFGESGRAWVDFYFRNLGNLPVDAAAFVMEYTDVDGKIIDRVPIASITKGKLSVKPFPLPFAVEGMQSWQGALQPGNRALMGSVRDGIRTGSCPARATVTFAMIQLSDGSVRFFHLPAGN